MAKRDDDDFIDPIKMTIGIIKMVFKLIKLIYDALTSPHKHVRIGVAILIVLLITSIGSCLYGGDKMKTYFPSILRVN